MSTLRVPSPGGQHDPFAGATWQGYFSQLASTVGSLVAGRGTPTFAVSGLPSGAGEGDLAFATNGRKSGEAAGAGTGVPVYWSNGAWRVFSTDAPVSS